MYTTLPYTSILNKHIALPQDHGSWVFLFTPLIVGLFAGRHLTMATLFLIIGVMSAFLLRQPATIAVKVFSKRRPRRDLPAAIFWGSLYALIGLASLAGLVSLGYSYLLFLALPGLPIFAWHLYLVSRRAERRQMGVELVATGVLSLAAPAAMWVGLGRPDPEGWWLWAFTWFQAAASLVYAFLRLEQRQLKSMPEMDEKLRMGRRAMAYSTFNLAAACLLSIFKIVPTLLPLAFVVQWLESIWGTLKPAIGYKPLVIGTRQLVVSLLFTLILILTWI